MLDKRKIKTPLEIGKEHAAWLLNKEDVPNIVVSFPDHGVFLMTEEEAKAHPVLGKNKIVTVKKDGKVLGTEEEAKAEVKDETKKGKKK